MITFCSIPKVDLKVKIALPGKELPLSSFLAVIANIPSLNDVTEGIIDVSELSTITLSILTFAVVEPIGLTFNMIVLSYVAEYLVNPFSLSITSAPYFVLSE